MFSRNIIAGLWIVFAAAIFHLTCAWATEAETFDDTLYAGVLAQYVDEDGQVDYPGLKARRGPLDTYARQLDRLPEKQYEAWDDPAKIAFWINAYNALTLVAIIDHYPIKPGLIKKHIYPANSIRQIPNVWDKRAYEVMDKKLSLNSIEHEILRRHFKEPRIHFALVCAAVSCPPLLNRPYDAAALEEQLDRQARRFVNDPAQVSLDPETRVATVSAIFDWFPEDFVGHYKARNEGLTLSGRQAVLRFIGEHRPEGETPPDLEAYRLKTFDYDWTLNDQHEKMIGQ